MFCEKNCSLIFCKFQETPVLESLFSEVAALLAWNLIKKRFEHVFSCKYSEIFKNTYFEVKTLEKEIYTCSFYFNLWSHTVFTEKDEKLYYSKRNMTQCEILIQLFPSWKQIPPSLLDLVVKSIQFASHPSSIQKFLSIQIYFWSMFSFYTSIPWYKKGILAWPQM